VQVVSIRVESGKNVGGGEAAAGFDLDYGGPQSAFPILR